MLFVEEYELKQPLKTKQFPVPKRTLKRIGTVRSCRQHELLPAAAITNT